VPSPPDYLNPAIPDGSRRVRMPMVDATGAGSGVRMKRAIVLVALVAGCATAPQTPFTYRHNILTTGEGRTLYVYARDVPGKSSCDGPCARVWPPYLVTGDDAKAGGYFSVITRDDGRRQWAFDGKPLYFNATDLKPGDRKGGGVDGVWSVVRSPASSAPAVGTPSMGTRYEGS
jgi:predicted lipoprotein with Yx(FWY)xxD motif